MKKFFNNVDIILCNIEEIALVGSLVVCMSTLFINVIARYIFNYSFTFSDELARYLMIYIIYLGMSIAYKRNSQLRLDLLIDIFPKISKYFNLLADIISLAAIISIFICGLLYSKELFIGKATSSVLEIPLFIIYGIAPLTAVFMIFRLSRSILKNIST